MIFIYFISTYYLLPIIRSDHVELPENSTVIAYTGDFSGRFDKHELVYYLNKVDKGNKVGEKDGYVYYKPDGQNITYWLEGEATLTLEKDNINGSDKDLKSLQSAFREIEDNSTFSQLYLRKDNHINAEDPYDLKYSAFNGTNAYIVIYKENGDLYFTKRLDNFFFTCLHINNDTATIYDLQFDAGGDDASYIHYLFEEHDDLNNHVELCLILNTTNGPYEFIVPLNYYVSDSYQLDIY